MGNRENRARELFKRFTFRDYFDDLPIMIEGFADVFDEHLAELTEGHTKIVNGIPVRKDKPHFNGDDYHATITFKGGKEASWYKTSGKRRHPNKFPPNVSPAHKAAAAQVLGKTADQLEWSEVRDEAGERYLLVEEKIDGTRLLAEALLKKARADKERNEGRINKRKDYR